MALNALSSQYKFPSWFAFESLLYLFALLCQNPPQKQVTDDTNPMSLQASEMVLK